MRRGVSGEASAREREIRPPDDLQGLARRAVASKASSNVGRDRLVVESDSGPCEPRRIDAGPDQVGQLGQREQRRAQAFRCRGDERLPHRATVRGRTGAVPIGARHHANVTQSDAPRVLGSRVMACPGDNTILALVSGELEDAGRRQLEAHLADCAECRDTVSAVARTQMSPAAPNARYVVERLIGAGGMGSVYAAYDPELDRRIALKFLHEDVIAPDGMDLLTEARTLARLAHPNVVAVYDVGVLGNKVVMAMEYVDGESVAVWLRAEPRGWREILDAFRQAGAGMCAAHAAAIVHGDFKPENLLRGRDGRVRLTDFGIARRADAPTRAGLCGTPSDAAAGGIATEDAAELQSRAARFVAGTPAYMAPEAERGVATALSDQFSFCVALCEALYGTRPGPGPGSLPARDATGALIPAHIRRALVRGLARTPNARHPTLQDLLGSLSRGVRRPRRIAIAAACVTIGLGVSVTWQVAAARKPSSETSCDATLADVWNDDRRAMVRAVFDASHLLWSDASRSTIEARFDAFAANWSSASRAVCRATHAPHQPAADETSQRERCLHGARAELRELVSALETAGVSELEHAVDAAGILADPRRCSAAAVTSLGGWVDGRALAASTSAVEQMARVRVLRKLGRQRDALRLAQRTRDEAIARDDRGVVPQAHLLVAKITYEAEGAAQGHELFRATLLASEAVRDDRSALEALLGLAGTSFDLTSDATESNRWLDHAAAVLQRVGTDDDDVVAHLAWRRGIVAYRQKDPETALRHFEDARAAFARRHGESSMEVGYLTSEMALVVAQLDRLGEAIELHERSVAISEAVLGAEHPDVGIQLQNLALTLHNAGEVETALATLRRGRTLVERSFVPNSPRVAGFLVHETAMLLALERATEALPLIGRALEIYASVYGPDHAFVAEAHRYRGEVFAGLGRYAEAAAEHERALVLGRSIHGADSPMLGDDEAALGQDLLAAGSPRRALRHLERALAIELATPGQRAFDGQARFLVARALRMARRDPTRASELARQAAEDLASAGEAFADVRAEIARFLARRASR